MCVMQGERIPLCGSSTQPGPQPPEDQWYMNRSISPAWAPENSHELHWSFSRVARYWEGEDTQRVRTNASKLVTSHAAATAFVVTPMLTRLPCSSRTRFA